MFRDISRRARRRRRRRLIARAASVALATAVLGGGVLLGISGHRGIGTTVRPGGQPPACGAPSEHLEVATVKQDGATSFDRSCLAVLSGRPFVITFRNTARGSQAISIYSSRPTCIREPHEGGVTSVGCDPSPLFDGDPVNGPGRTRYEVEGLPAGTYYFQSDVDFEELHGILEVLPVGGR